MFYSSRAPQNVRRTHSDFISLCRNATISRLYVALAVLSWCSTQICPQDNQNSEFLTIYILHNTKNASIFFSSASVSTIQLQPSCQVTALGLQMDATWVHHNNDTGVFPFPGWEPNHVSSIKAKFKQVFIWVTFKSRCQQTVKNKKTNEQTKKHDIGNKLV